MRRLYLGFTLLEALVTMLLVGVALSLSASLFRSTLAANERHGDGEKFVQGMEALDDLAESLRSAKVIQSPSGGSFESLLSYQISDLREDPQLEELLGGGGVFGSPAQEFLSQIEISVVNGQLLRRTTHHNGDVSEERLLDELEAFSAAAPEAGVLEIRLSLTRGQRLVSYSRLVRRSLP